MINYSQPNLNEEDVKAVQAVLTSNWLTTGPKTQEWEESVANFCGYRFAISVANATVGLMVAYEWYFNKVKYVFVPTLTFVATANMALRQGLGIKFADSDDKTLCGYTPDISVSYGGYPLSGRGLVADEAHYFYENMSEYGDYKARVISHHAVKPLACGDGGTILTNDADFAKFAIEYRNHGRDAMGLTTFPGSNLRMTDIQAALLLSQLDRWHVTNSIRHEIAQFYQRELFGYVELPPYHKRHALHLFPIKLQTTEQRDKLQDELKQRGIGTQIHYRPVHQQPLYQHTYADCPVADDHFARSLSIPLHVGLKQNELNYIVESIKRGIE